MSVNSLTYEDVSNVLYAVYSLATGTDPTQVANYGDFTSVATKTLQLGTEKIMNALTYVLSKTIFSERPYEAKFKLLELDPVEWGNIVRKINFADGAYAMPETTYDPLNGTDPTAQTEIRRQSGGAPSPIDPWYGKDATVIQTNFYGTAVAADSYKIREEALRGAFQSPEELAAFLNSLMTFINNRHEQFVESLARGAMANFILGRNKASSSETARQTVVHLLSEYNTQTGLTLTATTVYQPDNFKPFMQWVYARVAAISDMMTERTIMHHTELSKNGLQVLRHTPKRDQRILMYAPIQHMTAARVLADTYHDTYLRDTGIELVNYFGNVSTPQSVTGGFTYLNPDGSGTLIEVDDTDAETVNNIYGLILDRNAVGYMRQTTRVLTSPFNPADQSYTIWWHLAGKWVNDFSETGVLLLLD